MENARIISWTDEFRPKTIAECILSKRIKSALARLEETGEYDHMLFVGPSGVGKTTVARIFGNHPRVLMRPFHSVLGESREIRDGIKATERFIYGNPVPFEDAPKRRLLFADEAQCLPAAVQEKMKLWMESDGVEAKFLLAINDETKLHASLRSRMVRFDFQPEFPGDNDVMMRELAERCRCIVATKHAAIEKTDIAAVIERFFPDQRAVVNELYRLHLSRISARRCVILRSQRVDFFGLITICNQLVDTMPR